MFDWMPHSRRKRRRKMDQVYFSILLLSCLASQVRCSEVVIQIPEEHIKDQDGYYRLDYWPPQGSPRPNTTFTPQEVARGVKLSHAQPGMRYDFELYYSNATINDWATWTATITTVPAPPQNLNITVRKGKMALVTWEPPNSGYSAFKLKVIPLSEPQRSIRNVIVTEDQLPFPLWELTPGATYELQLHTMYEKKESDAFISSNFTTRPYAPGRFIVWYRNETTMLVLWQPPYPAGIYSHYRVSIDPPDAVESVLNVEKEGEPPGPAQAAFHGLVPGRAYNITVETVSEKMVSVATTQEYHTIPPPPRNVTFDIRRLTSDSFVVRWQAPKIKGEFDRYQLSLRVKKQAPIIVDSTAMREAEFSNGIEPGRTYTVLVKTVAVNVASWPTSGNVTTRPLPVSKLTLRENSTTGQVQLTWRPNNSSQQDQYKVIYQEVETFNGDSRTLLTTETGMSTELYPGRNYTVLVYALSNSVESRPDSRNILTKPASPIIEDLQPMPRGLNVSWKSDVTSRQDKYAVEISRNDTDETDTRQTTLNHALLKDLYPGAGYELKVYAISNGLWSEPHVYFQAVYPNSVRNLSITKTTNTTVELVWDPPLDSIFSHYVVRYRSSENGRWQEPPPANTSSAVVTGLLPGEKYFLQVRAVSYRVESLTPAEIVYTVPPNPVRSVVPVLDSQNITLEWPRPDGRIDDYTVIWWQTGQPDRKASKKIPGSQATEGISRKLSVLIGELKPGHIYNFEIYTTANTLNSDKFVLTTRTKPVITSEISIVTSPQETTAFTVRYTPTPHSVSAFDTYRFMLSDVETIIKEKDASDPSRKITFEDLIPGHLYNITAWTVSGNVTSFPLHRQDRLYPEPVRNISSSYLYDTSIALEWQKPKGEYDSFEIKHLNADDQLITNYTTWERITIEGLRPHRRYTFTVLTRAGSAGSSILRQSVPVSATFTTSESIPGMVQEFVPVNVHPNRIDFRWTLSAEEKNGVLHRYVISYHAKGSSHVTAKDFPSSERTGSISGLVPGHRYVFTIQAWNNKGPGLSRVWEQTMPIDAPPQPSDQVIPTEMGRGSRTITVRYRKNYFSEKNGGVIGYAVIVAEDDTKDTSSLDLLTWWDVQGYSRWPPYQAINPYYPFNGTTVEDFVIGSDKNCPNSREFCNGPLKPGSSYKIKIRAYTALDKFTDTRYSHTISTEFESSNTALAVAIPVLLLVVFAVGVVAVVKWRKTGPFVKRASETNPRDDVSISDSIIETSRPVELCKFVEHYRHMSRDSDYRFTEEYEALRNVGRGLACGAADLPVNRPKNRFTNILPYDHSRFMLQATDDEEGSDYINANYVSGFNSPREFIVTQGALVSTRDDYWRMCWESNSRAIVMLTRCIEKGREKCDHYWPYDMQPVYYGDIKVIIVNESHYTDWNITEFAVSKGDLTRIIRHFHFTTWPDFGVPDPPQALVRFVRAFRESVPPDHRPIVVHCSAGVGRSGTFIALDRILQSIRVSDYVDIFGIVYEMRRERTCMVQNEQQYICIHQCLMVVIQGLENHGLNTRTIEAHSNRAYEDDEGIAEAGM
uniref:protein-tyrosine-phosphatase n=2 Tax=Hirondellea gigas TaxID=1518452 RepID=A0A6A7G6Z0_9CRUS